MREATTCNTRITHPTSNSNAVDTIFSIETAIFEFCDANDDVGVPWLSSLK